MMIDQLGMNTVGSEAACSYVTDSGRGITFCAGTATYSAYPPFVAVPMTLGLGQNSVSAATQKRHWPHVTIGSTTTRSPGLTAVTSAPTSTTSPATSSPSTCGPSNFLRVPRTP